MSFDIVIQTKHHHIMVVSIPLEQGNVFRPCKEELENSALNVSIPLEQGNVFRHFNVWNIERMEQVSIPLEQGNVFRLNLYSINLKQ